MKFSGKIDANACNSVSPITKLLQYESVLPSFQIFKKPFHYNIDKLIKIQTT